MPRGARFLTLGPMLLRIGCPMRVPPRRVRPSDFDALFSQATDSLLEFSFPSPMGDPPALPGWQ